MNKSTTKPEAKKVPMTMSNFCQNHGVQNFIKAHIGENYQTFATSLISLTDSDPAIARLDNGRLLRCALNAASLDLPLNKQLGFAWVIPYTNHKTGVTVPQFQMGYKGFVQLAIRTNQYRYINPVAIREGELRLNPISGAVDSFISKPENKIVGYLGYFELLSGFSHTHYMTVEQLEDHAKTYSSAYRFRDDSLWTTNRDAMSMKTVLKLLLSKFGVLSVQLRRAILTDQTDCYKDFIDNMKEDAPINLMEEEEPLKALPEANEQDDTIKNLDANFPNLKILLETKKENMKKKNAKTIEMP